MWTPGREFPGVVDAVRDADPPVSCDPPTLEETRRAVNQLKSGKAPGGYGIHAEMLRAGGAAALLWLHTLCVPFGTRGSSRPTGDGALSFLSGRERAADWKRGVFIPILKGRVKLTSVTSGEGLPSSLYQARSLHVSYSTGSASLLTSAMNSLVSHQQSPL